MLVAVFIVSSLLSMSSSAERNRDKRQTYNAGDLLGFLSNLATQATSPSYLHQQTPTPGDYGIYSPQSSQTNNQGPSQFPGTFLQNLNQRPGGPQESIYAAQYPVRPGGLGQYPVHLGGPQGSLYPGQFLQRPGGVGLFPPGVGLYPGQYPASSSLIGALGSIARHDTLRCVPRLLCEVAAGGRPGYTGKQESIVPFISRDSLLTLLTVFNFGDESPLLIFGRAALLGITAQGDPRTCLSAYPTCPRDPDQLVYYLNNHNGGFFRFFNRPLQGRLGSDVKSEDDREESTAQIFKTNIKKAPKTIATVRQENPVQFPKRAANPSEHSKHTRSQKSLKFPDENGHNNARITTGGGFHSDEIIADTVVENNGNYYGEKYEAYPPYGNIIADDSNGLFPEDHNPSHEFSFSSSNDGSSQYVNYDESLATHNSEQYYFPSNTNSEQTEQYFPNQSFQSNRRPKTLTRFTFPHKEDKLVSSNFPQHNRRPKFETSARPIPMVFPDRTGTGDLRLDTDESGRIIIFSSSSGLRDTKGYVKFSGRQGLNGRELKFPHKNFYTQTHDSQKETDIFGSNSNADKNTEKLIFPSGR